MSSFNNILSAHRWDDVKDSIYDKSAADVEVALQKTRRTLEDFKALISPAARAYLEPMARLSHALTCKRFGRTIQLYIPLYLSNECQNICTYCGFSLHHKIPRKTLTEAEILQEAQALKAMGYEHVLLVTGEANLTVGTDYLAHAMALLKPHFANISMEVQPLDEADYVRLKPHGLHAVLVYQETYHEADYKKHHPKGRKANFQYRLETPDRLGRAGIHKIGLGVLYGLEDWRTDTFFTALHLQYLERTYWQTQYSISFPRLRPIQGELPPKVEMTDKDLVQVICAYRLLNQEVELSLSTRETESFRNHMVQLGITAMSAGSKTNPGGYTVEKESLEQFQISDERSPQAIADMIRAQGYALVWKNWERGYG